jgi:DNA integrity scanning protein DisA with diadenylate cyclase activity
MAEIQLRIALQRFHSRRRLALQTLDLYQTRLLQLAGPLPIQDAAEVITLADGIRDLLTEEEVDRV